MQIIEDVTFGKSVWEDTHERYDLACSSVDELVSHLVNGLKVIKADHANIPEKRLADQYYGFLSQFEEHLDDYVSVLDEKIHEFMNLTSQYVHSSNAVEMLKGRDVMLAFSGSSSLMGLLIGGGVYALSKNPYYGLGAFAAVSSFMCGFLYFSAGLGSVAERWYAPYKFVEEIDKLIDRYQDR